MRVIPKLHHHDLVHLQSRCERLRLCIIDNQFDASPGEDRTGRLLGVVPYNSPILSLTHCLICDHLRLNSFLRTVSGVPSGDCNYAPRLFDLERQFRFPVSIQ